VTSMLTVMSDGSAVEAGSVGREGVVGSQTAFGSARIIERWICQVPGDSIRVPAVAFRRAYQTNTVLRRLTDHYTQAYMASLSQSVACNRLHTLYERCARWLLLTHDRVGRDDFMLTQEFLSIMLGVRRPGVSVAAATLARAGFISYVRGNVRVLDRRGLESASCECYVVVNREYQRLFFEPAVDQSLAVAAGE
jgi:CRP-like cAMP-binding protein